MLRGCIRARCRSVPELHGWADILQPCDSCPAEEGYGDAARSHHASRHGPTHLHRWRHSHPHRRKPLPWSCHVPVPHPSQEWLSLPGQSCFVMVIRRSLLTSAPYLKIAWGVFQRCRREWLTFSGHQQMIHMERHSPLRLALQISAATVLENADVDQAKSLLPPFCTMRILGETTRSLTLLFCLVHVRVFGNMAGGISIWVALVICSASAWHAAGSLKVMATMPLSTSCSGSGTLLNLFMDCRWR